MTTQRQVRLHILLVVVATASYAWVQPFPATLRSNNNRRAGSSLTPRLAMMEFLSEPATYHAVQSTLDLHTTTVASHAEQLLTTLLSPSVQAGEFTITPNTLQPAHGHVASSWFGNPDPYLALGKSIAPSTKALDTLGLPTSNQPLPDAIQKVLNQGWKILDARTIQPETFLPGFTPPSGILPAHTAPPETPESFAIQVEWSARFLKVVDKLPEAAFAYALVEFFLLRPNIDLYKEEIRQEPGAVAMETAVTTAVRLAAFCVVAVVTLGIFG